MGWSLARVFQRDLVAGRGGDSWAIVCSVPDGAEWVWFA